MKKSRKIKFFFGVLVIALLMIIPITNFVNATVFPTTSLEYGSLLYPGDQIDGSFQWIQYNDYSGDFLYSTTDKTVFSYQDAANMNENPYAFKCWKIIYVYASGGEYGFTLEPVDYDVYTIDYELYDGVNSDNNPTYYLAGKSEFTLDAPTREHYNFGGWFSDAEYTVEANQVTKDDSGNLTFYAKWIPEAYDITYVLDGGVNADSNPNRYYYGTGVDSFADASKTGYSFKGWYSDSQFTIPVYSVSPQKTDAVTLYAKFEANDYEIEYHADGAILPNSNPDKYTYGVGVASFDAASLDYYVFKGWYSDENYSTEVTSISETSTGKVDLFAKFEPEEYDINYYLDGGENATSNPAKYTYGAGVTSFAAATKTGYTFKGWYGDASFTTEVTSIGTTESGDVELFAKYEANEYNISYELNGGVNATSNPAKYTYGVGVTSFAAATKTGYTFKGWYGDASFTTEVTSVSTTSTGNITLYAKFEANEYNISYALNGGVNATANPAKYTYGTGVTSFADATKTGYTFKGWYSDTDFTTKVTSISATSIGNVTLYAKYEVNEYNISYVLNGGVNATSNPTKYTYGTGVASFASAIKNGYTFRGWYSDANFTTEATNVSATSTGNVTLYAKFEANDYTITYVLNAGTNALENPTGYTYGVGVASFADATKTGYTFKGWYSDTDFTTKVTSISATSIGNVTLYAKYEVNEYNISYVLDGGVNATSNASKYTYGVGVASFAAATKTGYTFKGWYGDANFTTAVTKISTTQLGDVTLYAKYEANEYNISYVLNGGVNATSNPSTYTYGTGVTSFASATKDGYTFGGWYSDEQLTTKVTSISATNEGDVSLYAKFSVGTYAIEYVLDGGTNSTANPDEYIYGVGVAEFEKAEKTGYIFEGWYGEGAFENKITNISTTQLGKVTLYAKFKPCVYGVTYETNSGELETGAVFEYTYGVGIPNLVKATLKGHDFEGWYSDADFADKVISISTEAVGDITLFANYVAKKYNITYVLDGGVNAVDNPVEYTFGVGVESFAAPVKTDYKFLGWYADAEFTEAVENIPDTAEGDITLYAKFEAEYVAPPTGDNSGILMITVLLVCSGLGVAVLRKREDLQ